MTKPVAALAADGLFPAWALRQSAVQFFDEVLDSDVPSKFATLGIMLMVDTQMRAVWSKADSNRWSLSGFGAARAVQMTEDPCHTFRNGRFSQGGT